MTEIGFLSVPMQKRVVNATLRSERQFVGRDSEGTEGAGIIPVRNISGHEIPAFGLMQVKRFKPVDKSGYYEVIRPKNLSYDTLSTVLVNGYRPIPDEKLGAAQAGPEFIVKAASGSYAVGSRIGWKDTSFDAELGCLFKLLGYDTRVPDVHLARCQLDFSSLYGTATSEITSTTPGTVDVDGVIYTATTKGASIPNNGNVVLWPYKGTWLALRVC